MRTMEKQYALRCLAVFKAFGGGIPIDVVKKDIDIFGPVQSELGDVGVFKNIHDQDGRAAGQMAKVMLIDPFV